MSRPSPTSSRWCSTPTASTTCSTRSPSSGAPSTPSRRVITATRERQGGRPIRRPRAAGASCSAPTPRSRRRPAIQVRARGRDERAAARPSRPRCRAPAAPSKRRWPPAGRAAAQLQPADPSMSQAAAGGRRGRGPARRAGAAADAAANPLGPTGGSGGWAIPYAIVLCESGGQNLPPNSAGASGYYQIIPSTWKLFGGTGPAAYLALQGRAGRGRLPDLERRRRRVELGLRRDRRHPLTAAPAARLVRGGDPRSCALGASASPTSSTRRYKAVNDAGTYNRLASQRSPRPATTTPATGRARAPAARAGRPPTSRPASRTSWRSADLIDGHPSGHKPAPARRADRAGAAPAPSRSA